MADNYVLSLGRKTRFLLLLALLAVSSRMTAQSIDFDNGDNSSYTASGFTAWSTGDIASGKTAQKTVDGVTITIGHGSGTQADVIKTNWNKNGVQNASDESKQINDGIFAGMKNDTYGGYGKTTAKVAISVTLSGLTAGTHTLRAYHNYVNGTGATLPTIGVAVDGVTKVTGVAQSQQATTLATAASSFVTFEVTAGSSVTLTYFSEPNGSTSYTTTYFYINSLEIDVDNADNQAQLPSPANLDYHVAADNGSVTLQWTAAANGPTCHTVYLGTDKNSLQQVYQGTATSYAASGLNPMQDYYWRVDETIGGTTYAGTVWTFRPRRLAFPGAEGGGMYAQGGRGGVVYHVTSLADDGAAGTLRYGLESLSGPRTIVFDVSGVIQLTKTLTCSDPYVTIAGQTAPGIGIMLRDQPFGSNSNDGITRFMRFRYGHGDDWDGSSANANTGNAAGLSADYGIMDHCLLGWGSDETFSSRGAGNYSFQHNIIGESLNQNGHKNYWDKDHSVKHGYAATIAGDVGSLHHNLLAHNEGRNWSLGGGLDASNTFAGRMNIYNNVCYNWGGRATDGGAHNVNFVGNYYKKGPATTQNYIFSADHEDNFAGTQEYYLNGNLRVSQDGKTKTSDKLDDTYRQTVKSGITVDWETFVSKPYDFWSLESGVETAEAAFKNVLSDVGCNYAGLDQNEKRLIQESRDGTYTKTGSRSGKAGLVDKESDSEGWSGLGISEASRPADWDTDRDGIPDWFEEAKGWDAHAANNNTYNTTTYYTNLEEYLNWMAEPHFTGDTEGQGIAAATNKTITLADYFAGYTSASYSVSNPSSATATVSGGVLTVNASQAMAGQLFTVSVTASEGGISLTRNFNFYVAAEEEETLSEYTLSSSTYENSTETVTWNFENDFTITNNSNKGYSTGNDGTVKYSNNVQFTINIPDGISISKMVFYGYSNDNTTDGYLKEVNGTAYGANAYVFPAGKGSSFVTRTITFDKPVTGTITFTTYQQCALAITLYGTTSAETTVTETGTITWVFNNAVIGDNLGEYSTTSFGEGFTLNNVSLGSNLSTNGTKNSGGDANYKETAIKATAAIADNAADSDDNAVRFTVGMADGYTFMPTAVSFIASKNGTNGGKLNIYWQNTDGTETTLATGQEPLRIYSETSGTAPYYTQYTYDLTQFSSITAAVSGTCGLKLNVNNLTAGKSINFYNIIITGTLTHTEAAVIEFTENEATFSAQGTEATLTQSNVTAATTATSVGATVKHGGKTYQITAIASDAFAEGTALQTIDLTGATNLTGTVARFSGIPDNALVYLPVGVAATGNNMVTYDGSSRTCANLVLTDAQAFNNIYTFRATVATYWRSLLGNMNPKTLIVPYQTAIPAKTKAYRYGSATEKVLTFTEVTGTLAPNTPYILFPTATAAGTTNIAGTAVEVPQSPDSDPANGNANGWTFCGTLQGMDNATAAGASVYNLSAGRWLPVKTSNTAGHVSPLRCYMRPAGAESKTMLMEFETPTGIRLVEAEPAAADRIYNLAGQRVGRMARGIYIKNGQKYVK